MKRNAVIVFFCLACLLLGGCSKESAPEAAQAAVNAADTGLTISIDQLKTEPTFWDWNQNGVAMQVIALLDSAGKPHIAYKIPVRSAWVRPTPILNIRTGCCTA